MSNRNKTTGFLEKWGWKIILAAIGLGLFTNILAVIALLKYIFG